MRPGQQFIASAPYPLNAGPFFTGGAGPVRQGGEDEPASVQLPLATWLVAPTSTSARAASFRPELAIGGVNTRVIAEQTAAINACRLGMGVKSVGFLSFGEMRRVDAALRVLLDP